ncbi:MAG: VCBS repeat-containing protein, partial [Deltaproteobacteria bacterium]|nr:VCBS repeat-containing protein [Deltaproteobacteria bacterium]
SGAGGNGDGGGPPTIGDFDGDGTADVALAAGNAYVVFDGGDLMNTMIPAADAVLWASATNDCSSAQTGSTLFDFDGNGRVEVVYGDQEQLRIYDGLTGTILAMHPHPTGTINEYPVVADVDADGQADIVAVTRETCGDQACGQLRVYGSATGGWVRTRRVWNQHTYHVTNIEEDGSIPIDEQPNWTTPGLNNFRQNKQPGGEFTASDAAVTLQPACFQGYSLQATVRNLGQAPLPAAPW